MQWAALVFGSLPRIRELERLNQTGLGSRWPFSVQSIEARFGAIRDVSTNCFMCGRFKGADSFTEEHVIPDWLLRHTGLHDKSIELPTGQTIRYSRYKIRCCGDCNAFLGREFEEPISAVVTEGYDAVLELVSDEGGRLDLLLWLSLIFLKSHLKDCEFRENLDLRLPDGTIGENYAPGLFHHLFCIVRARLFEVTYAGPIAGTIIVKKVTNFAQHGDYDFKDNWITRTIYIRIKDICIISSLSDQGSGAWMLKDKLKRVPSEISIPQSRELFGDLIAARMHLTEEPKYRSIFDRKSGELLVVAERSKTLGWHKRNARICGWAQLFAFSDIIGSFVFEGNTPSETMEMIASGDFSQFPLDGSENPATFTTGSFPDLSEAVQEALQGSLTHQDLTDALGALIDVNSEKS